MFNILNHLPRAKINPNGWNSFNAVCCQHRGETKDTRKRGGLKVSADDVWVYHCFNCNFMARYEPNKLLSKNTKLLLTWLGIPGADIRKLELSNLKNRTIFDVQRDNRTKSDWEILKNQHFETIKLPNTARKLTIDDEKHYNYILSRGLTLDDYNFYITPTLEPKEMRRNKNRIIIPYMNKNNIVGYTSRYLDTMKPKYLNIKQQEGYLFGVDFQKPEWIYAIVTEGIFDALSIKGLAVMHNEFTRGQMATLNTMGKEIIVVPDQDHAGLQLVTEGEKAGYSISVPNWGKNSDSNWITDINEAVQKYGKAAVLYKILQEKVSGKIKIKMAVDKMKRRIKI